MRNYETMGFAALDGMFRQQYDRLMAEKKVCMSVREVAAFCHYCAGYKGVQPCGGALTDDGRQYLYVD